MSVACKFKLIEYKKFVKGRTAELVSDWQERKQMQWDQVFCQGLTLLAIRNGWTITAVTTFVDGEQHRMTARCP
jgi:hypothetical protein